MGNSQKELGHNSGTEHTHIHTWTGKKELERKNSQILFVFAGDNQLGWMKQTGHQFIEQNGYDRIEKKNHFFCLTIPLQRSYAWSPFPLQTCCICRRGGSNCWTSFSLCFYLFFFLTQLLTLPDHKTMAENLVLEKYCVQLTLCSFSLADVEIWFFLKTRIMKIKHRTPS